MSGRPDDEFDPRLERALHDALAARDPGPAPRALRERVDRVPEQAASGRERRSRANSALMAVAGLAATLLLVAVLGPMLAARPTGPATSPNPSGVAGMPLATTPPDVPYVYPEMTPYVIDSGGPSPLIDPVLALPVVLVVAAMVVLGVATGRRVGRRRSGPSADGGGGLSRLDRLSDRQLGLAWVGVLVAAVALVAVPQPLSATVNGTGGSFLVTVDGTSPVDVFDGETTAPHPGQVSFGELTITNRGLLPVTLGQPQPWNIEGLPIQPGRFITPRLTYEEALAIPEPEPVMLWPGQSTYVRILYEHLPCEAWGVPNSPTSTPWPTIGPDGEPPVVPADTEVVVRTDLPVAGSVLGLPRTLVVDTGYPFGVVVPTVCPPSEPMTVADPSRVPADLAMGNGAGLYTPETAPDTGQSWIILVDVALAVTVVGIAWALRRRRALAVLVVGVALATAWWTVQPASLSSDPTDLVGQGQVSGGEAGVPTTFDVGTGGVLTFGFTVHNDDPASVTLLGVETTAGQLRLTGLGRPWGTPSATPSDNAAFFVPVQVEGGATLQVLGQATAGSCARTLAEPHDAWIHLRAIPFTYERLGVRHATLVPLASSVRVPGDAACLVSAAMPADGREAWFPVPASGVGVPADPVFLGGICPWLGAGMAVLLTVAFFRRRDRRRAGAALAGAVILGGWWAFGLLVPVPLAVFATEAGIGTVKSPNDDRIYVNVAPGDEYGFGIGVSADHLVPLTITGVATRSADEPWTGLWTSAVPDGRLPAPNQPVTAPGPIPWSEVGLWVAGEANACAVPFPDPANPPDVATTFVEAPVAVRVEVLGIPRTIELDWRSWPIVPVRSECLETYFN